MADLAPSSLPPSRLVLTGFMGSGKTTVGRLLAQRLAWTFCDLDDCVAARERTAIPTLIANRGEAAFRRAETLALGELLQRSAVVVALGGGAPETAALRSLLQETDRTCVVYLQSSFPVLYERCRAQACDPGATVRPFLGLPGETEQRYNRRVVHYEALAHLTVDVSSASPECLAEQIRELLVSPAVRG